MKRVLIIVLFLVSISGLTQAQVDIRKNAQAFSDGIKCKYRSDNEGAIKHFEEALKFNPDDAASMFELSEQYILANRVDEGFAMIKKAAELDPQNKWYQMRLAMFYRHFEQYEDFVKIYEPLTDKYPGDINMLSELIDVYIVLKKYDKALEKTDLLVKQVGADTRYYHILANAYMDAGKEKKALEIYDKIKALDPNDQYINISLLEYYEKKGKLDKAFDELIDAIHNENLDFATKSNIYEYWFNKFQSAKGIDQQALRAGNAFVEEYPESHLGYMILASYHMNRSEYEACLPMVRKGLACDHSNYYGWQYLLMCEVHYMEFDSVRKHSVEALQYYPTQPLFYWYAGMSHAYGKQDEQAIVYFEKGRKFVTDPQVLADFDSYLGDLYHSVGEVEKSFEAYDRVLRVDPDNALVLNNYAYYLSLRKERLNDAKTMAQHAVELAPENAIYLDTYAWVLYELGDYQAAEIQMAKAVAQPIPLSSARTYYEHYIKILEKANKPEKAEEYRQKLKEVPLYEK